FAERLLDRVSASNTLSTLSLHDALPISCIPSSFARLFDLLVIGHDEVRVVRDEQASIDLIPQVADHPDFLHHGYGIDHDPISDDAGHVLVENATRNEMEHECLVTPADRVTCVRAALVARYDVHVAAEQINDLALALISPLRSNDYAYRHRKSSCLSQ